MLNSSIFVVSVLLCSVRHNEPFFDIRILYLWRFRTDINPIQKRLADMRRLPLNLPLVAVTFEKSGEFLHGQWFISTMILIQSNDESPQIAKGLSGNDTF